MVDKEVAKELGATEGELCLVQLLNCMGGLVDEMQDIKVAAANIADILSEIGGYVMNLSRCLEGAKK